MQISGVPKVEKRKKRRKKPDNIRHNGRRSGVGTAEEGSRITSGGKEEGAKREDRITSGTMDIEHKEDEGRAG